MPLIQQQMRDSAHARAAYARDVIARHHCLAFGKRRKTMISSRISKIAKIDGR